jgi:hypothetical protein
MIYGEARFSYPSSEPLPCGLVAAVLSSCSMKTLAMPVARRSTGCVGRFIALSCALAWLAFLASCGGGADDGPGVVEDDIAALDAADIEIVFADGDSASVVTRAMTLPAAGARGASIAWKSSASPVVSADGTVARPGPFDPNAEVTLTATASHSGRTASRDFALTVRHVPSTDDAAVAEDIELARFRFEPGDSVGSVTKSFLAPAVGVNGSIFDWPYYDINTVYDDGGPDGNGFWKFVRKYDRDPRAYEYQLPASVVRGASEVWHSFSLTIVPTPEDLSLSSDLAALRLGFADGDCECAVTQDIAFPQLAASGRSISWTCEDAVLAPDGTVSRPGNGQADAFASPKAAIVSGGLTAERRFTVRVLSADPALPIPKFTFTATKKGTVDNPRYDVTFDASVSRPGTGFAIVAYDWYFSNRYSMPQSDANFLREYRTSNPICVHEYPTGTYQPILKAVGDNGAFRYYQVVIELLP